MWSVFSILQTTRQPLDRRDGYVNADNGEEQPVSATTGQRRTD